MVAEVRSRIPWKLEAHPSGPSVDGLPFLFDVPESAPTFKRPQRGRLTEDACTGGRTLIRRAQSDRRRKTTIPIALWRGSTQLARIDTLLDLLDAGGPFLLTIPGNITLPVLIYTEGELDEQWAGKSHRLPVSFAEV